MQCENYGKTFHKPKFHIERNEHHFCSEECKKEWQGWGKRIEKECEECGEKFEVIPGNKNARFCSQE